MSKVESVILTEAQRQREYSMNVLGVLKYDGITITVKTKPDDPLTTILNDEKNGDSAHLFVTISAGTYSALDQTIGHIELIVTKLHQGYVYWYYSPREIRENGLPVGVSRETEFSFGVPPWEEE